MSRLRNLILPGTRKALLAAALIGALAAGAQTPPGPDGKVKEKKLAAGEPEAKQLLLLMDRDASGKVSRQEFMTFMAEFERLNINKDGELDVNVGAFTAKPR